MTSREILISILFSILFYHQAAWSASQCISDSGPQRVVLVELFTSEGCSSCPPADRWLGKLASDGHASVNIIPLAFHVDYWDYIGWRDPYAHKAYTARQYAYTKMSGNSFAYTPQILLSGRNYPNWFNNKQFKADADAIQKRAPGVYIHINQSAVRQENIKFEIQAIPVPGQTLDQVQIHAALFQNGLVSDVLKGENRGARLQHDYVVRELVSSHTRPVKNHLVLNGSIQLPAGAVHDQMGLVVFAQNLQTGEVLQAISLPLCE